MEPAIEELIERQHGVVARWQLLDLGATHAAAANVLRRYRRVHQGVMVSGHGPLTDHQWWLAASLTTPQSSLSTMSAAACAGFFGDHRRFATVVRPGNCGPRRFGDVLVTYSRQLTGEVMMRDGIRMTSPPRTILDLLPFLDDKRAARLVRDALRVGAVDGAQLRSTLARHRGRAGVRRLAMLVDRYGSLEATRTRSDAELLGVALIEADGLERPEINVKRAGLEADLSWDRQRVIVELDGPQFHQFPDEDAIRDLRWSAAGWSVTRMSTDFVYDEPREFLALVCELLNSRNIRS